MAISVDHASRPPGGLLLHVHGDPGGAPVRAKLLTALSRLFRASSQFPPPRSPVPLHPPDKVLLILKVPLPMPPAL